MPKIQTTQSPLVGATTDEPQVVDSAASDSRLDDPGVHLAWDNDVRFQISRHLLHLRRLRRMSQDKLAKKIGTSQSHIAKIEAGDENFTLVTLGKIIGALDGRFRVSIAPAEFSQSWPRPWFDAIAPAAHRQFGPWTLHDVEQRETADTQEIRFTWGRKFGRDTLPKADLLLAEAKAS